MKHGFGDAITKVGLTKFITDLFWVGMFYHLYNQVHFVFYIFFGNKFVVDLYSKFSVLAIIHTRYFFYLLLISFKYARLSLFSQLLNQFLLSPLISLLIISNTLSCYVLVKCFLYWLFGNSWPPTPWRGWHLLHTQLATY